MPFRVVQWTTGNVGRRSVEAVANAEHLELVGCYAWSSDKVGQDVADLCGLQEPTGVLATDDIDALVALGADCLIYNPLWPDVATLERFLSAGVNVVATAGFITGRAFGSDGRQRIAAACEDGGASMFGSGMNPGFANLLGLVSAGICDRVDKISVLESVDSTGYGSAETEMSVGYGRPGDDPELAGLVEQGTAVFGDAVAMMADALDVDLDEITCASGVALATRDLELGYMMIPEGCVAGVEATWSGIAGGEPVIELSVRWRKGQHLEPDWPVEHGYLVEIEGQPRVRTKLEIRPPKGFVAQSMEDFMVLGMIATAMPAVLAVPAVCAADPGIVTYRELPVITASGFTGRTNG